MSSEKKTLLFTGATGYIGGAVLAAILNNPTLSSAFTITAIVRSVEKAEKLKAVGVKSAVGSISDEPFVENLVKESDWVISTADADNYESIQAILRGAKHRFEKTKVPTIFIHTSGTGVLTDDAKGKYPSDLIYDDANADQIESLAPTQLHRNVDLEIVKADKEGYIKSYIVLPSTIFGIADHKLVELGISNAHSQQVPGLIRAALDRKRGGFVGEGKNIWPNVHISEVAEIYVLLALAILQGKNPGHGREGYYFGENDEYTYYQVGKKIAEVLVELGLGDSVEPEGFTKEELDKYFGGSDYLGSNSRCRGNRSRSLGWKPVKTTKDLLDSIKPEVEALAKR